MRRAFLAAIVSISAIFILSAMTTEAAGPDDGALLRSIQELGISLHQALHCDHTPPTASGGPQIADFDVEIRLDHLSEAVAQVMDPQERSRLEGKIEQLRMLAYNLDRQPDDLAAESIGSIPAPSAHTDRPATAVGLGAPIPDGCSSPLSVGLGTATGTTVGASNDGQASCGASLYSPDVWFDFTAPFDGIFFANTLGSTFDTVLSTHSACPGTIDNQLDCNDDQFGLFSSIRLDVSAGQHVLIRLAGAGNATGDYTLNIAMDARVGGRISEQDGGAPIEGTFAKVFSQDGAWIASDQSDSNGDYLVTGLDQGDYFVGTAYGGFGHINELYDDITCPNGPPSGCDPTTGDAVTANLDATTVVDFQLVEESTISGTVSRASDGTPLQNAMVNLYSDTGELMGWLGTDPSGDFTFHGLAQGTYYTVAGHSDFLFQLWDGLPCSGLSEPECDPTTGNPLVVGTATATTGIDFALVQMGAITGVITESPSGVPISASIEVMGPNGFTTYSGSGPDGVFEVTGLQAGTYYVATETIAYFDEAWDGVPCEIACDPSTGTPISVSLGATTTGIDLSLVRLGSIAGTVTDAMSSIPIPDLEVAVYDLSGTSVQYDVTDPAGNYLIEGLLPGDYFVATRAHNQDHSNQIYDGVPCPFSCDPTTGTPVTVLMAATTTAVDFSLPPTGGISGTIVDAATGLPIEGLYTEVWREQSGPVTGLSTDAAGAFLIDLLPAGTYYVATHEFGVYLDTLYDGFSCWGGPPAGCDPTKGTPIIVTAGATTTGIDLELTNLDAIVFTDGFESGATGAWSNTLSP